MSKAAKLEELNDRHDVHEFFTVEIGKGVLLEDRPHFIDTCGGVVVQSTGLTKNDVTQIKELNEKDHVELESRTFNIDDIYIITFRLILHFQECWLFI